MKELKIINIGLLCLAMCACTPGCNTEEDDYDPKSNTSTGSGSGYNSAEDATDSDENGYIDDGTGDDLSEQTFTKTIVITYNQSQVTVEGVADSVSIATEGALVTVTSEATEIEYILRGSTENGNLKIYSTEKFKLTLDGVSLMAQSSSAINIQTKKKVFVELVNGTTSNLSDGATYQTASGEDEKACLFSEGQLIFCGSGVLNVSSQTHHGICSDDYVTISDACEINVTQSGKDGIHANDFVSIAGGTTTLTNVGSDGIDVDAGYFIMTAGKLTATTSAAGAKVVKSAGNIYINNGTLSLKATGGAEYDSEDRDYKTSACLKADSSIVIRGGTIEAQSSGVGGKGLSADMNINVSGGSVSAISTGSSGTSGSAKGIKADGNIVISGGAVYAKSSSHEGMEAKGTLEIQDGVVEVEASDDAINSASHMTISGGRVYAHSTGNDGLDSNGNLYIKGGVVVAYGSGQPECGIDANDEQNYHLYITGGYVFGIGGSTSPPYSTTGSQAIVTFSTSAQNMALTTSDGTALMAWNYNTYANLWSSNKSTSVAFGPGGGNQPGGSSGSYTVLMSCPSLSSGTSYTLKTGVNISASNEFHGLSTDGTVSGGSSSSTSTAALSGSSSGRW